MEEQNKDQAQQNVANVAETAETVEENAEKVAGSAEAAKVEDDEVDVEAEIKAIEEAKADIKKAKTAIKKSNKILRKATQAERDEKAFLIITLASLPIVGVIAGVGGTYLGNATASDVYEKKLQQKVSQLANDLDQVSRFDIKDLYFSQEYDKEEGWKYYMTLCGARVDRQHNRDFLEMGPRYATFEISDMQAYTLDNAYKKFGEADLFALSENKHIVGKYDRYFDLTTTMPNSEYKNKKAEVENFFDQIGQIIEDHFYDKENDKTTFTVNGYEISLPGKHLDVAMEATFGYSFTVQQPAPAKQAKDNDLSL